MKLTIAAALFSLTALTSALAIQDPDITPRDIFSLEARQKKVSSGACCVDGVNRKEDACTPPGGAASSGLCVPDNGAGCKEVC